MGFFVSRHLGLVGCNIVLMKRFLPLFMLTGLLFGQDVITIELKNGDKISGQVVSETESQITVKTNFGDLDIPKVNIALIEREITENENTLLLYIYQDGTIERKIIIE